MPGSRRRPGQHQQPSRTDLRPDASRRRRVAGRAEPKNASGMSSAGSWEWVDGSDLAAYTNWLASSPTMRTAARSTTPAGATAAAPTTPTSSAKSRHHDPVSVNTASSAARTQSGACTVAQKPAMQVFMRSPFAGGQQSAVLVQRSLVLAHFGMSEVHVPTGSPNSESFSGTKQKPPQQSMPDVQVSPSFLHGSSAANARWLPVPTS